MIYTESPRRKQINDQVSWGHWFAFANIVLAIFISSVYVIASPAPSSFVSSVYLFLTWFGHISFVIFFGFICLLLPLCYQVTHQRVLKTTGSIISALALAMLAFDALLFNKTGFHISFSSAELLRDETQGQISAFSWLQWFYLALLFIMWLMFQLVIANTIFKNIKKFQKIKIGKYVTSAFLACFVTSHAIHVWADAKLYAPVLQQDNMFPLSYPATAKTLMSRAGLLDLQDYRQRQDLQFSDVSFDVTYPLEPIYCSVDNTKKVVFLRVIGAPLTGASKGMDTSKLKESGVNNKGFHFISNTLNEDYLASVLYGMPQAFLPSLSNKTPLLLELPSAFDVDINIYAQQSAAENYIFQEQINTDFSAFANKLTTASQGLFIGIIEQTQLNDLDIALLATQASVMLVLDTDQEHYKELYSNLHGIESNDMEMSSTEDIAPSIIAELGCKAQAEKYSMGQAIQNATRHWSLSTQGSHLVVVHDGLITEVSRDGSFEIRSYQNNQRVLTDIDTNLLSRSIKHFSRFTQPKD